MGADWLDVFFGVGAPWPGSPRIATRFAAGLMLGAAGPLALAVVPWLMLRRLLRQRRVESRRELLEWALRHARKLATLAAAHGRGIRGVEIGLRR